MAVGTVFFGVVLEGGWFPKKIFGRCNKNVQQATWHMARNKYSISIKKQTRKFKTAMKIQNLRAVGDPQRIEAKTTDRIWGFFM